MRNSGIVEARLWIRAWLFPGRRLPAEITPESIKVDHFAGMIDTGRFEFTGKADLKAFQPTSGSAKLILNTLPVIVPDTLDVLLNADINLKGTDKKSSVTGEIVLLEGLYSKDVNLNLLEGIGKKERELHIQVPVRILHRKRISALRQ